MADQHARREEAVEQEERGAEQCGLGAGRERPTQQPEEAEVAEPPEEHEREPHTAQGIDEVRQELGNREVERLRVGELREPSAEARREPWHGRVAVCMAPEVAIEEVDEEVGIVVTEAAVCVRQVAKEHERVSRDDRRPGDPHHERETPRTPGGFGHVDSVARGRHDPSVERAPNHKRGSAPPPARTAGA